MNVENMKAVADFIENKLTDEQWRMDMYLRQRVGGDFENISVTSVIGKLDSLPCGTVGCVAGWTVALLGEQSDLEVRARFRGTLVAEIAARKLDLTDWQADHLFCGLWSHEKRLDKITRQEAADAIRDMVTMEMARRMGRIP